MKRFAALLAIISLSTGCDFYQDVGDSTGDAASELEDATPSDAYLTDAAAGDPQPGRMTVTGRIHDLETGQPVSSANPTGQPCDASQPSTSGPCSLHFRLYDALPFANNPETATAIDFDGQDQHGGGALRDDGTFVAENIVPPQLGFLAIAVRDAGATDPWRVSAIMLPAQGGLLVTDLRLRALRASTDEMWTSSAGFPAGTDTFTERGVYLATYVDDNGHPVSGVKVTHSGSHDSAKDYYFGDIDPWTHTVIDPARDSTGPNGSALMVDVSLSPKSGSGNEVSGCAWPEDLGAAIPGVLFGQLREPYCQ